MNEYMKIAIEEAKKTKKDIPVGAVIVKGSEIVARFHNKKEEDKDITSHAEILALRESARIMGDWRLEDCDMYVTLEPCPMCGWAILQSRVKNLYFGSYNSQYGAFSSSIDLTKISNTKTNIYGGIMEKECDKLIDKFFENIRN